MTAKKVPSAPAISIVFLMTGIPGLSLTPELDRNFNSSAAGRRISRARHKSSIFISLLLMVAISMMTMLFHVSEESDDAPSESPSPARIKLLTHDPIIIEGNAGFLGSNASTGVSWGSGTESDPFIIADWDINASSANGIDLRDIDVHFIIRNCYLHDGGHGIYMENCVNGWLASNICWDNLHGILLNSSCNNNTLSDNSCARDFYGIYLASSCNNNTLSGNSCSRNYYGINLESSCNDNTLSNNDCGYNAVGVFFHTSCNNNTLVNNSCLNNIQGMHLYSSCSNTLSDNDCSWNDGMGIFLDSSCNNNTLVNNSCSNNNDGDGIGLLSSNNNTLSNNTCSDNSYCGLELSACDNNNLSNNTCSFNYNGILVQLYSESNNLSNNTCSSNSVDGIVIYSSDDNNLNDNNCISNKWDGIGLYFSSRNTLVSNNCSYNEDGIYLSSSSNSILIWNQLCSNSQYGVYIRSGSLSASYNRIWNNTFYHNNGARDTFDPLHIQARDDGTGNRWNSSEGYGNNWSDWRGPDLNPMDGIVDYPYPIDGSSGSQDYYPIAEYYGTTIPEFGAVGFAVVIIAIACVFIAVRWKLSPSSRT